MNEQLNHQKIRIEHNQKSIEVWTKVYLEVQEKSVIKYDRKYGLWSLEYTNGRRKWNEIFSELELKRVEKIWREITHKVVNDRKNERK